MRLLDTCRLSTSPTASASANHPDIRYSTINWYFSSRSGISDGRRLTVRTENPARCQKNYQCHMSFFVKIVILPIFTGT